MTEEKKCCCVIHATPGWKCPNCPVHNGKNPNLKPRQIFGHQTRDVNTGGKL